MLFIAKCESLTEFDGVTNIISKLTFETELNIYFLVSPFIFCAFEHDEAGLSIKR
jgi:hypothetical protein